MGRWRFVCGRGRGPAGTAVAKFSLDLGNNSVDPAAFGLKADEGHLEDYFAINHVSSFLGKFWCLDAERGYLICIVVRYLRNVDIRCRSWQILSCSDRILKM